LFESIDTDRDEAEVITTDLSGRLWSTLEAFRRQPEIIVEELALGGEADAGLASRARGVLPADLVDFLAKIDGVRFTWRHRADVNDYGGLHVPPLAEAMDLIPHEFGAAVRYCLVDDLQDGHACYYRVDLRHVPRTSTIVYASTDAIVQTTDKVCDTFVEYIELAQRYRFRWDWHSKLAGAQWLARQ
jgi:hypothetical protein